MRHALIITAYRDVEMLNRIIQACPINYGIFIHVDKKSCIDLDKIGPKAKVFSWEKVYWGSWEHLYVIVKLLDKAVKDNCSYDYFHIISGGDFFSANPLSFDEILGDKALNYLDIFKLPNKAWGWGQGLNIWKYKTISSYCDIRKMPYRIINNL